MHSFSRTWPAICCVMYCCGTWEKESSENKDHSRQDEICISCISICIFLLEYSMKSPLPYLSIFHLISLWGCLWIVRSAEFFGDAKDLDTKTNNITLVTAKATSSDTTSGLAEASPLAVSRSWAYNYDLGHYYCPSYYAINTNSATNYETTSQCYITMCGGYTMTLGSCSSDSNGGVNATCSGNQALRLLDANDNVVATSGASCGTCSQITYYGNFSASLCETFSIWEGCFSSESCSGEVGIQLVSLKPTLAPTTSPSLTSTPAPTTAVSRSWATDSGDNYYYCPFYSASNTNSATTYDTTSQCYISLCPGDAISLGSCSSYAHGGVYPECSGNQVLRLVDDYGNTVATSSATCGTCAELSYTVPSYTSCESYRIWEGCNSAESCSGQVGIELTSPTLSPSLKPTLAPTTRPSLKPTPAPTTAVSRSWATDSGDNYYYCPFYSASNTNSATTYDTTSQCYISLCPGDAISLGSCSSYAHGGVYPECSGNQVLRLVDDYGNTVATSSATCDTCAELSYTVPSYTSCESYRIWEGCNSAESCSGQVGIELTSPTLSPSLKPTLAPTASPSLKPTPPPTTRPSLKPTLAPTTSPSLKPTPAPTTAVSRSWATDSGDNYYYCPFYSASNTNSATTYDTTSQCYISLCPGDAISLGSCSSYAHGGVYPECSGNQVLRLVDGYGNTVATSSATCGTCAELSYTVPSYTSCESYRIWEGCNSAESCSGEVGIELTSPTLSPSLKPTLAPTASPSLKPTPPPTTRPSLKPTPATTTSPSLKPTPPPTTRPSLKPTLAPTTSPSLKPTPAPTTAVSRSWAFYYGFNYYYCLSYSASNTDSANTYATTSQCYISLCPGDAISLGSCSSYAHGAIYPTCSGNQVLRLVDGYGNEVATNTATCGTCAELSYTVPSYTSCQTYSIWEGCNSAESCSGAVVIELTYQTATTRPSLKPTFAPTTAVSRSWAYYYGNNYYYCPFYSASNTNSANTYATTSQCYISLCPGNAISLGSCSSYAHGGVYPECSGNQVLRLVDSYGDYVATSSATCGTCAELSYTVPSYTSCQTYSIWEGCNSAESCSGQVGILLSYTTSRPSLKPTSAPPVLKPTPAPTTVVSRSWATISGDNYYYCPFYSASNTNSANTYATTSQCYISLCPGDAISLGSCSSYAHGGVYPECSGNQVLRLVDGYGNTVATSSATCGTCAELSYTVPSYTSCEAYSIWEGCNSAESCSGEVVAHVSASESPTLSPTFFPSFSPSLNPNTMFTFATYYSAYGGLASTTSQTESIWVQSLAEVLDIPSSEVIFISTSAFVSAAGRTGAERLTEGDIVVNMEVKMLLSDLYLPYGATLDDALDVVNNDITWLESPSGLQSLQDTLISVANGMGDSSFTVSVAELQCSTVVVSTPVDDDDGGGDGGSVDVMFCVLFVFVPIAGASVLFALCWWLWRNYCRRNSSPPVVVDQQQNVSRRAGAGSNNNNNNVNSDQNVARDLESAAAVMNVISIVHSIPDAAVRYPSTTEVVVAIPLASENDSKLPSAPPLP